jgi:hypothetical protein
MIITQFMMTKHDQTIPDAFEVYEDVRASYTADELSYVGFKTVGHSIERLHELGRLIVSDGRRLVVEIVGDSAESEAASANLAVSVGADILIGGQHPDAVLPILAGSSIGYYPSVGDLTVEPGRMYGEIDEIVAEAEQLIGMPGVDGVMLLGYRFVGDQSELIRRISAIEGIKVVNAGTVDSAERIQELDGAGFWAFTIGSAVLDRALPAGNSLREQLDWVMAQAN